MKKRLLLVSCLLAGGGLKGDDAPTVDLFAGWGWSPFWYDSFPYRYGPFPYGYPYPAVGLGVPLNAWGEPRYSPYGYYGGGPFWGYDYGVRVRLKEPRYASALSENLLRPLPGSAPTEIRDAETEQKWDQVIGTVLRLPVVGGTGGVSRASPPLGQVP
ncbi:MAG: hypothetical protein PHV28_14580 [Kiritimatiellae bacterium]|nr:hypothetical protein [Kiritimatiellia bacterium]